MDSHPVVRLGPGGEYVRDWPADPPPLKERIEELARAYAERDLPGFDILSERVQALILKAVALTALSMAIRHGTLDVERFIEIGLGEGDD